MSKTCCKNPKNLFCFVCGMYVPSHHKRSLKTQPMLKAYESYFKVRTATDCYQHGPPSVCNTCNNALLRWVNGNCTTRELPFAIPMLWGAPTDHATDCYFCLTRVEPSPDGKKMIYPSVKSAVRPKVYTSRQPDKPSLVFHPIQCTTQSPPPLAAITPDKAIAKDNAKMVRPKPILLEPEVIIKPHQLATRHSLPAAKHTAVLPATSVRLKAVPTVVNGGVAGVKRKATDDGALNDVSKVRLRISEPIMLKRQFSHMTTSGFVQPWAPEKETAAVTSRNATAAPKILNVFSLNKKALNDGSTKIILSGEKLQPKVSAEAQPAKPAAVPITIEIDDDEEEEEEMDQSKPEEKANQQQQQAPKAVQIKQEVVTPVTTSQQPSPPPPPIAVQVKQEPNTTQPVTPKQFTTVKIVKVEPRSPPAGEQKRAITNTTAKQQGGFINLCDLASSSANVTMVVKMQPVTEAARTEPTVVASSSVSKPVTSSASTVSRAAPVAITTPDCTVAEPDEVPHRITQSELILLLRELELSKEKSAILIDKLKKWNLLAIELVGTNRSRPSDPTNGPQTAVPQQQQSTVPSSPPSASAAVAVPASVSTPPVTAAASPATSRVQCGQYTATVTSLSKMKDLQVRSTRATTAKPQIITSSTNSSKTRSAVINKQEDEAKPVPKVITSSVTTRSQEDEAKPVPKVITSSVTTRSQEDEAKPVPKVITSSVTTRSAKIAQVKQNVTPARIK